VALTVGVLLFYHSVGIAILAWVVFNMIILLWILALIGRNLLGRTGTFSYGNILRYVFPLGLAGVIAVFATSSDTVLVGGFLNLGSLAVYGAATTISGVLGIVVLTPLTSALLPEISSSGSLGDASYGLKLAFKFTMLAILPASLLVAGVSTQLLSLFTGSGSGYLSGSFTLEMIALFYVFLAVQNILLVLLQAVGKTRGVIVVGIVTALTDVGLALLLVPQFGLAGAVASRVAVYLDGAALSIFLARTYLKNLDPVSYYLKGAIAAGLPFVIVLALSSFVSARLITLVPYAALYGIVFLVLVKRFRLLGPEDRKLLSQTLPLRLRKFVDFI
jgi:O-antigen/teichoic acid export membrane protein